MAEENKKVIGWFTANGHHVPIFEKSSATLSETKKEHDIAQAKKQADRLNGVEREKSEDVAKRLYQSEYNKVTKAEKDNFNEYRQMVKEGTADSDVTFWIIEKDGTSHTLNPIHDTYDDYKKVDLRKVAYMQVQSGDDVSDSMGLTASKDLGYDEGGYKLNAYNEQVEKLYGTEWGKKQRLALERELGELRAQYTLTDSSPQNIERGRRIKEIMAELDMQSAKMRVYRKPIVKHK